MAKVRDIDPVSKCIVEQNPWLVGTGEVPDHLALPTERPLGKHLWGYILKKSLKHLIILGARRVGKTTVMYQTVKHLLREKIPHNRILWVRLDHPDLMNIRLDAIVEEAIKLSKATLDQPAFLFLDELVYAKDWDLWLKTFYDEKWPVKIIASSSATAILRDRRRESGIGRWEEVYLAPYLLNELLELQEVKIDIKAEKCLGETVEQVASSPPFVGFSFSQTRKNLMSLGGFPEILSEQWTAIKESAERHELGKIIIKHEVEEILESRTKKTKKKILTKEEQMEEELYAASEASAEWQYGKFIENGKFSEEKFKREIKKEKELTFIRILDKHFLKSQQALRSDAIERAIYKDITQSYRIDNPMALERFFYTLAGQITGLLSLKDIGKNISISEPTLERYLSYLMESYLVFTLPNYAKTEGSVQRRGRKVYFVDGAIRNAALQKGRAGIFDNPVELGHLQENTVAAHLRSLGDQAGIRLYYWRRKKYEVDFVYDDPRYPLALEIGSSSKHSRQSLRELLKEQPRFKGGCYYVAPGTNFISAKNSNSGIGQLPLDLLLLASGIQQEQALKARLGIFEEN